MFSIPELQPRYEPFLDGIQLATVAEVVSPHLNESWPVILEAVTINVTSDTPEEQNLNTNGKASPSASVEINATEYKQVWTLSIMILSDSQHQRASMRQSITSFPSFNGRLLISGPTSEYELVALRALQSLCTQRFHRPDMLSVDLCQELLQVFFLVPRGSVAALIDCQSTIKCLWSVT